MGMLDVVIEVLSPFGLQDQEEVLVLVRELTHRQVLVVVGEEELGSGGLLLVPDKSGLVLVIMDEDAGMLLLRVQAHLEQVQIPRQVHGPLAAGRHILNLNELGVIHQLKFCELEIGLHDHQNFAVHRQFNVVVLPLGNRQIRDFVLEGVEWAVFGVPENVETHFVSMGCKHQDLLPVVAYFELDDAMMQEGVDSLEGLVLFLEGIEVDQAGLSAREEDGAIVIGVEQVDVVQRLHL